MQDEVESGGMADDELAHAVMMSISDQLDWDDKTTVDWYAFAVPRNGTDDKPMAIQVRKVLQVKVKENTYSRSQHAAPLRKLTGSRSVTATRQR